VQTGDRATTLQAMQVLHRAAAAADRKVLWCLTTDDTQQVRAAGVADTVTEVATAHRRLRDHDWTLPPGSLVIVDRASAAPPAELADLAGYAQRSQASLILLDPDENRAEPGPSAPLMKLLHSDLPWAVTLSVSDATPPRRLARPDLDPLLDQAERLADDVRTPEIADALARRTQLRAQHEASHRVHTELRRAAQRDTGRDQGQGLQL